MHLFEKHGRRRQLSWDEFTERSAEGQFLAEGVKKRSMDEMYGAQMPSSDLVFSHSFRLEI